MYRLLLLLIYPGYTSSYWSDLCYYLSVLGSSLGTLLQYAGKVVAGSDGQGRFQFCHLLIFRGIEDEIWWDFHFFVFKIQIVGYKILVLPLLSAVGSSPKVKKNEDADFDMFAQSRTATYENAKVR